MFQSGEAMLVLVLALNLANLVYSHVSLTFPPARKYDLDFLDTVRTTGPCGMKKGVNNTKIQANRNLKIQWHLGYPHRGSYRLRLFNEAKTVDTYLTSGEDFVASTPNDAQEASVSIPDVECNDCTIQLERQALEWGENYRFHSCADVEISRAFTEDCSGHGTPGSGSCSCDKLYHGPRCQFKDDCQTDSDCNNQGKCLEVEGSSLPNFQCFCEFGHFGRNCEKMSKLKSKEFQESEYQKLKTRGVEFLWKFKGDELDAIVIAETQSYVAIGWKPDDLTTSCYEFPPDADVYSSGALHEMDCSDIVIGTARGSTSRIEDFYTRDRSTPRLDSVYGGKSDLTGALGWEEDGKTYIRFTKPRRSTEKTDHTFEKSMEIIWAFGQDTDFYKIDEIKYHGPNRGHETLHLKEDGSIRVPVAKETIILTVAVVLIVLLMIIQTIQNCNKGRLCCARK